jgi:antirestriction protein ArdC
MNRDDALQRVTETIQRLTEDPDAWAAWAQTLQRFHKYSYQNALLIWNQAPEATYVAGYQSWKRLGRYVRKGEHGISIFAPIRRKVDPSETAHADPSDQKSDTTPASPRVLSGIKITTVFDIRQTDGEPLSLPQPAPLMGDGYAEVLHALIPLCGVPVQFGDTGEAYGIWSPQQRTITLRADIAPNHQLKSLIHEWAHSLGIDTVEAAAARHVGTEEIIAEATAATLSQLCGLDTAAYSAAYVGSWAQGDPHQVTQAAQAIVSRVHHQIGVITAALDTHPILAQAFPTLIPLPTSSDASAA